MRFLGRMGLAEADVECGFPHDFLRKSCSFFCVRKFFAHLCGVVYGGVTINSRRYENGNV